MNRLMLPVLLAVLLLPVCSSAQAPADSFPTAKIAWINLEQVVFTCDEGKAKFSEIQAFVDEKNKENDKLRAELDKLRNQLQVQGSKLTDEARADLEEQIEEKETGLQRFQQDTQKEIENRRLRTTNYIGKQLQAVLEKVAKDKGIHAILFFNSSRDAYVDGSLNLSEEVIKYYNQMHPVAAAKAPAAAAPAKKQ
ncbi:MAG: OmpH family outer membrane protein [Acidobacteriota bacterium]|jgi:Skp family chaperone for outer membrane proteins|nr:OmpH family outer membrane protein [Acidobacteriota bacterium]